MKHLAFVLLALTLGACSTAPNWPSQLEYEYLQYTIEFERQKHAEEMAKLETAQQLAPPEMPLSSLLVPRVCVSEPIYDVYGRYVRTSVQCK